MGLIIRYPNGGWGLRGVDLATLPPSVYGALCKLKDFEARVEDIDALDRLLDAVEDAAALKTRFDGLNDFSRSQCALLIAQLREKDELCKEVLALTELLKENNLSGEADQ